MSIASLLLAAMRTLLLLFVLCSWASATNNVVRSTDELLLTYVHRNAAPLYGNPGEMHRLELLFKNLAATAGTFKVTQTSSHESFVGKYPTEFQLDSGQFRTIEIRELIVPTTEAIGSTVEVTVSVERIDPSVTAKMRETHLTMLFLIGPPQDDRSGPRTAAESSATCLVDRNNTALCDMYKWHVELHAQDRESGLRSIELSAEGKDSFRTPVQYNYPNFAIGTKEIVDVNADISCCIEAVRLTAVNGIGIQTDSTYSEDQFARAQENSGAQPVMVTFITLCLWTMMTRMI